METSFTDQFKKDIKYGWKPYLDLNKLGWTALTFCLISTIVFLVLTCTQKSEITPELKGNTYLVSSKPKHMVVNILSKYTDEYIEENNIQNFEWAISENEAEIKGGSWIFPFLFGLFLSSVLVIILPKESCACIRKKAVTCD